MNDHTPRAETPANDSSLPAGAHAGRVDALMAQLTLAEKAGQLTQYFYFGLLDDRDAVETSGHLLPSRQAVLVESALSQGLVGALLFVNDPTEINRLQRLVIAGNRLGIPALFGYDVIHGFRTIFPVPIALAASWDPDLIERSQAVAAREARAAGIHWTFAPNVDIARDPRWGRMVEGAGEDPYLGAAVAAAQVRGFQGGVAGAEGRLIAGPKHFAGYGGSLGGRDYDEVNLSDHELWNVYLAPFRAAIEAGAANIMSAYMDLNGIPATANRWLLRDVLRDTWGFDGFVVSDAQAVHNLTTQHFAADATHAAASALTAGVDMEMAIFEPAYAHLADALDEGLVDKAAIDESVRRILVVKERLGLFENPYADEEVAREVLGDSTHRAAARRAAQRCAVLLKNEGGLLPLEIKRLDSIAVIGPLATSKRDTLGPWSFAFDLEETITIFEGLEQRVAGVARITYAPGIRPAQRPTPSIFDEHGGNRPEDPEGFDDEAEFHRATDLARNSDVAVVVVGEWQNLVGEQSSRAQLTLPGRQDELLRAVVATGTPVVLLVMNGRPLDLGWAAQNVSSILDVWYPGTAGGSAVADLVFGDVNPGGKLPFTWPRSAAQSPLIYAHTRSHDPDNQHLRYWDEPSTPLYRFGHGLSYTEFRFGNLRIDRDEIHEGQHAVVSVEVENVGMRPGDEVAQLYVHQRHGTSSRPVRELKGFRRVSLDAGEKQTVSFRLGADELRYWNSGTRAWVLDSSTFDVWVGADSTAPLHATFRVKR